MKKVYFTIFLIIFLGNAFYMNAQTTFPTAPTNENCGTVLNFDGVDKFVSANITLPIGNTSSTIEAWIKVFAIGTNGLVASERIGNIYSNYNLGTNGDDDYNVEVDANGYLRFYWKTGTLAAIDTRGTTDLRDDKWHHIAIVRDTTDNTVVGYLDGQVELNASNVNDLTFTESHVIGGDNRDLNGGPIFHGAIDELRVWNIAKTQAEITTIASQSLIGNEAGLIRYYNFNEGGGSLLNDLTGNDNATLNSQFDIDLDWTQLDGSAGKESNVITNIGADMTTDATMGTYQWINCLDNSLISETSNSYTATENGNYSVIVTNGTCVDTANCVAVIVSGTNEYFNAPEVNIYPNPATNQLNINSTNEEPATYSVLSATGVLVKEIKSDSFNTKIDLSDLTEGTYLLNIKTTSSYSTYSFVKE